MTAPSEDSTLQSDLSNTQENAPTNIPRRRNTIWSDTVDEELVACLSPKELNRQEALFEIIKTEHEYVRYLRLIEEYFITPIKQAEEIYCKRIIPESLNKVFNSISYFLFIHETISNTLNERQENQFPLIRSISDIFLTYVWVFRAYIPYIIHYEDAVRELDECIRKKDKLGRLVRKQQKSPTCRNMPLSAYLLKPFQRLLVYPELIVNLLKGTDKEGFDYDDTASLKTKVEEVLSDVVEMKRNHDNMERLRELETRIQGLGPFRLAINNRQLLRESPACQGSITLKKQPSLRKSLTVKSSATTSHSVQNLYTLECNDIVLLAERTGATKDGHPVYKLVSKPPLPNLDDEQIGIYYDDEQIILKGTNNDFDYEDTASLKTFETFDSFKTLKTKLNKLFAGVKEQKREHYNIEIRKLFRESLTSLKSISLTKQPPLEKLLTVMSSPITNPNRHLVQNLCTLECKNNILLVERTSVTKGLIHRHRPQMMNK